MNMGMRGEHGDTKFGLGLEVWGYGRSTVGSLMGLDLGVGAGIHEGPGLS